LTAVKAVIQSPQDNTEPIMKDYSKRTLMEFIETSIKKGWINLNTGGGVRTACRQILEQLSDEDDVRGTDVADAVGRFANRNPGKLSGPSLRVYQSRVQGMLDSFVAFVDDPVAYKPPSKSATVRAKNGESKLSASAGAKIRADGLAPVHATTVTPPSHASVGRASSSETSLTLPFNLRPDFLAQITVPRDLTKDEAKRLSAFIDALAL